MNLEHEKEAKKRIYKETEDDRARFQRVLQMKTFNFGPKTINQGVQ